MVHSMSMGTAEAKQMDAIADLARQGKRRLSFDSLSA